MKKRKPHKYKYGVPIVLLLGLSLLCIGILCVRNHGISEDKDKMYIEKKEAATMLSFTLYSEDEWENMLDIQTNCELTEGDVRKILGTLNLDEYISCDLKHKNKRITRENWNAIYDQILDLLDINEDVTKKDIFVLEKTGNHIVTQDGDFLCLENDGFYQSYRNYECYFYNNQIVGFIGEKSENYTLESAYLMSVDRQKAEVLYQNKNYTFPINSEEQISGVCDIVWRNGEIEEIRKKEDQIAGNLLWIDENSMEISGYGVMERKSSLPVYQLYDGISQKSLKDIVIGNMQASYVIADQKVCAVLLTGPAVLENVRILLLADDGSKFHSNVFVVSDGVLHIKTGSEDQAIQPGTVIGVAQLGKEQVTLQNEDTECPMYFCDENGNRNSLGYYGEIDVRSHETGYSVVNNVEIEKYLYAVVPSEMPSSYHLEALKAQAVCARSYVYRQIENAAYPEFGAHVDDSTAYQVYNKQESSDQIKTAVNDTAGLVMKNGGIVVESYYYSTSCGFSETDIVWNKEKENLSQNLICKELSDVQDYETIADETLFRQFIDNPDMNGYDSFSRYYRWNTSLNFDDVENELKDIIKARYMINPENISLVTSSGDKDSAGKNTIDAFGNLKDIVVISRDDGGIITELDLQFEKGTVKIYTEYNIRRILAAGLMSVTFMDGSVSEELSLLPSAYFYIDKDAESGNYVLHGGGMGHGVGMSQNGAEGLAGRGMDFTQILTTFYQNIQIEGM